MFAVYTVLCVVRLQSTWCCTFVFAVYTVLLQLKDSMLQGEFLMAIRTMPAAYTLFVQLCRHKNREQLRDLYEQEDNHVEEAACRVWDSYQEQVLFLLAAFVVFTSCYYMYW